VSKNQASLAGIIFAHAARQPQHQALYCDGSTLSYAELADRACGLSRGLHALGVQRGDHIGVALPNSLEFALLLVAAADLGAVLVPVSPALPPAAMQRAFAATDVRHIVALQVILQDLKDECPQYLQQLGGICLAMEGAGERSGLDTLSAATGSADPLKLGRIEDPYILTMTSGSTGDPKPIVFEQRTKLIRARVTAELYGLRGSDRMLAATPMYHSSRYPPGWPRWRNRPLPSPSPYPRSWPRSLNPARRPCMASPRCAASSHRRRCWRPRSNSACAPC
jgi:acyl-CoA synthetase (AMP-forming)/AMP-acid ligase II